MIGLISGILGPSWWQTELGMLPVLDLRVRKVDVIYVGNSLLVAIMCSHCIISVLMNPNTNRRKAVMQALPIFMLITCGFLWSIVPQNHPRLICFTIGVTFTYLTNRMILSAMCQVEYPSYDRIVAPMPLL